MTDEQINIAIAEACGRVRRPDGYWFPLGSTVGSAGIPNYCNDLNAMHEAEKTIAENKWSLYRDNLRDAVLGPIRTVHEWCKSDLHATARQRAEAFLRTLSRWEES